MPFIVVRNDLVSMRADAIVNTANPEPVIGGGTDRAVYEAAGPERLLAARKKIGQIGRGEAAITPAFRLHARYIIHTVGPKWQGGRQGEEYLLRACYRNSLKLAREYGCRSIAFPLISTGVYGFPKPLALSIVNDEVRSFLDDPEEDMAVYLVVFDEESAALSADLYDDLAAYIDDHYAARKAEKEYARRDHPGVWEGEHRRRPLFSRETHHEKLEKEKEAEIREYLAEDEWPGVDPEIEEWISQQSSSESFSYGNMSGYGLDGAAAPPPPPASPKPLVHKKKRTLDEVLEQTDETFQQMLLRLIQEKGMTNAQAYKKANQDKKLFSKIKGNVDYQPKKTTAVAFAIALELNLDQTKDLLGRAGYALSNSNKFDIAIMFFIENQIYDIFKVEEGLFDHNLPLLCNY